MIERKKVISGVENIYAGEEVYFKTKNGEILDSTGTILNLGFLNFDVYSGHDKIFLRENENKEIFLLNKSKLTSTNLKGDYFYELNRSGLSILFFRDNEGKQITLYQNKEKVWTRKNPGFVLFLNEYYLITKPGYRSNIIEVRSLLDFSLLHTNKLGKSFYAGRYSYILNNVAVLVFTQKDPKWLVKLIGIDLLSNKKKWEIDSNFNEFLLDETDYKLYSLLGSTADKTMELFILNAKSGSSNKILIDEGEEYDIMPWNASLHQDKIFYSNNVQGCELGVVDLINYTHLTKYQFLFLEGIKLNAPRVHQNKIYITDTEKSLHIFEANLRNSAYG